MNLDPEPKVFLQNKLIRNQQALEEVIPRVEAARRESGKLAELRDAYTKNPALGDLDSVTEVRFIRFLYPLDDGTLMTLACSSLSLPL